MFEDYEAVLYFIDRQNNLDSRNLFSLVRHHICRKFIQIITKNYFSILCLLPISYECTFHLEINLLSRLSGHAQSLYFFLIIMHCVGNVFIAFEHQSRVNGMANPICSMSNSVIDSWLTPLGTRVTSRDDSNQCPSALHFSHQWTTAIALFNIIQKQ